MVFSPLPSSSFLSIYRLFSFIALSFSPFFHSSLSSQTPLARLSGSLDLINSLFTQRSIHILLPRIFPCRITLSNPTILISHRTIHFFPLFPPVFTSHLSTILPFLFTRCISILTKSDWIDPIHTEIILFTQSNESTNTVTISFDS